MIMVFAFFSSVVVEQTEQIRPPKEISVQGLCTISTSPTRIQYVVGLCFSHNGAFLLAQIAGFGTDLYQVNKNSLRLLSREEDTNILPHRFSAHHSKPLIACIGIEDRAKRVWKYTVQVGKIANRKWEAKYEVYNHVPANRLIWKPAFAFPPNGKTIAMAISHVGAIELWPFPHSKGDKPKLLKGHDEGIDALAFSSDSSLLASVSYDETVRLWSTRTGKQLARFPIPKGDGYVLDLAFARDNRTVWIVYNRIGLKYFRQHDNSIHILRYDIQTKKSQKSEIDSNDCGPTPRVAVLANGCQQVITGANKGRCCIWDLKLKKPLKKWTLPSRVRAIHRSLDSKTCILGTWDGTIQFIRFNQKQQK